MGLSAAVMRKMADMGLSLDQIIELAEQIDADTAPRRTSAAERQARYRERQKQERDVTRDVTSVTTDPLDKEKVAPKEINPPKGGDITTRAREADQIREHLTAVLSPETAKDLIDHRKKLKKPLTAAAARRLAGKLALCRDGPEAAADAMIANGWQGFEPEWMNRNDQRNQQNNGKSGFSGVVANLREMYDYEIDDLHGGSEPVSNIRAIEGRR